MNPHLPASAAVGRNSNAGAVALLSALVGAALFAPGAQATIIVGEAGVNRASFPTHFYGSNSRDVERATFDWESSTPNSHGKTLFDVLPSLNYGIFRFPCGTDADYWKWKTGTLLSIVPGGLVSTFDCPLSELKSEIDATGTAEADFVMNLTTDPSADAPDNPGGPTVSGQGDYQLNATTGILAKATAMGLNISYVELGNELYAHDSAKLEVYTDSNKPGYTYGGLANKWISNIHGQGNYKVAAAGADRSLKLTDTRRQNWNWGSDGNSGLFNNLNLTSADAVIIHIYPEPNLAAGTLAPLDNGAGGKAQQLFGSVFLNYQYMKTDDFGPTGSPSFGIPKSLPVWVTEYNLDTQNANNVSVYCGTWAHGLAMAAMSLQWLEQTQIQVMIHHCNLASAGDGDIFESTDGLDGVSGAAWSTPPATELYGPTASGLVMKHIDTAALSQTAAKQLTFSGFSSGSTFTVQNNLDGSGNITVPRLYGWEFTGSSGGDTAIVLNLDNVSHTLDLSGVMSMANYNQVFGDPGAYVSDGDYQQAYDYHGNPDNLTYESGSGLSITLQPFSITQIGFTHK